MSSRAWCGRRVGLLRFLAVTFFVAIANYPELDCRLRAQSGDQKRRAEMLREMKLRPPWVSMVATSSDVRSVWRHLPAGSQDHLGQIQRC